MSDAIHAEVAARLTAAGQRYTPHRRSIVGAMLRGGQPLTIPEIVAAAPGVPQSSVYRTVAALDSLSIVHRMDGPGDFARFELDEELLGHHHHLVCTGCGAVRDVHLPAAAEAALDTALRAAGRQEGFVLERHRLDLLGRCGRCAGGVRA